MKFLNLKIDWTLITLLLIISLGAFLRFYRITVNFPFDGEIGHNLLAIKNFYVYESIPLIGPPTSHEWLYFGPYFYWIYGPILILSGFNPLSHAIFGAFVSLIIIPINYLFVKKLFNKNVAIISSFLISVSPLFIYFSYWGRFFQLVAFLNYPLVYFFYKFTLGKRIYIYPFVLTYSLMFSFHYSQLMLAPFFLTIIFYKKIKFTFKEIFISFFIFLFPFTPFIYYDFLNKTEMIKNLFLWIPYRFLGFLGLYPKNNLSTEMVKENGASISNFINYSFVNSSGFTIIFTILVIGICVWIFLKKRKSFPYLFILIWFLWGILAVFIHGNPPLHYFLPIFPLPIIFLSILITKLWKKKFLIFAIIIFMLSLLYANFSYYFSPRWFYKDEDRLSGLSVPYPLQIKVVEKIIEDADGKEFSLRRVGENDQFEKDFAQNYIYLFWFLGNEPLEKSDLSYTIFENLEKFPDKIEVNQEVFDISNIKILKTVKSI